jgi:hypothetical protein
MSNTIKVNYTPSPTFEKLHADNSMVRAIGGPVGSGKSVGMVMEILLRGLNQKAFRGVRQTRWAVVRNTYNELKNTTIKTWSDWIPAELGVVKMTAPPTSKIVIPDIGDGTRAEIEVIFLALDREEDQAKLRSFELTGIWFNEAQFADEEIVRVGLQRTGRYPKVERDEYDEIIKGSGPTWSGALMDFNLVDTEHLLYRAFKTEKRAGWNLWIQPPAIEQIDSPDEPGEKIWVGNPEAENIKSHANEANGYDGYRYYLDKLPGMKLSQIYVDFCAKWGVSVTGQPVYAETYDDEVHVAAEEIKADRTLPMLIGMDFGLHPAIVFGQLMRDGRLVALKEIDPNQPSGVSLEEFLEDWYRPFIVEHFMGVRQFDGWGDPAGRGRNAVDKRSPFMVLAAAGIRCSPTITNEYLPRKEAVEKFLMKRNGLIINPSCTRLRKGFLGGYGYKKVNGLAKSYPEKNAFSHVHDAFQYLCLGLLTQGKRAVNVSGGSSGCAF